MKLILNRMVIESFKGIKALEISFNSGRTDIRGKNGTGKSSIVDAFCWALFDKDAHGNAPGSNFIAKPLGDDGNELHNLTTAVQLDCELDGAPFSIRREQSEKWTKPRGKTEQIFSGNVSAFLVNGVPMRQADFKAKIAQIATDDIFRLLGTLGAFNALKWQDRRAQLMALADIDVDAELSKSPDFAPLMEEMQKRGNTLDELRKALKRDRAALNDELKAIPARIDEQSRNAEAVSAEKLSDAHYIVKTEGATLEKVEQMIATAKSEDPAQKRQELETALQRMKQAAEDAAQAQIKAERVILERSRKWELRYSGAVDTLTNAASDIEVEIVSYTATRDILRAQYTENREKAFNPEENEICPCCGQKIPEEMRRAAFVEKKKQEAESISKRGKECSERLDNLKSLLAQKHDEIEEAKQHVNEERESVKKSEETIASIKPIVSEEQLNLEKALAAFDGGDTAAKEKEIADLSARREELRETIARNQAIIAQAAAAVKAGQRVEELENRQKECADRLSQVERLQIMAEQYEESRCERLNEAVNAHFPTVCWKLTEHQINGGLIDTCVCMIPCDGALVDYSTANTAAQVNADVEIITALSAHYGVSIPLFVDNAERVNHLAAASGQLIALTVSDGDLKIQ